MSAQIASGPSEAEMDIALSKAGFVHGAQSCREMMARFVENSPPTDLKVLAGSIRANWHPGWGVDPGPLAAIPDNPLGDLAIQIEILDIEREANAALIAAAPDHANGRHTTAGVSSYSRDCDTPPALTSSARPFYRLSGDGSK